MSYQGNTEDTKVICLDCKYYCSCECSICCQNKTNRFEPKELIYKEQITKIFKNISPCVTTNCAENSADYVIRNYISIDKLYKLFKEKSALNDNNTFIIATSYITEIIDNQIRSLK